MLVEIENKQPTKRMVPGAEGNYLFRRYGGGKNDWKIVSVRFWSPDFVADVLPGGCSEEAVDKIEGEWAELPD